MLDASLSINSGDWMDRVCIDVTAPCWMETLPLKVGENKLDLHFAFAKNLSKGKNLDSLDFFRLTVICSVIMVEDVSRPQTFMIETQGKLAALLKLTSNKIISRL